MKPSLLEKISHLLSLEEDSKNESELRELVGEIFSRSDELFELVEREGVPGESRRLLALCLRKLRSLNNSREAALRECPLAFVELDRLLEGVCLCGDILLSDRGVKLGFESERIAVSCCPTLVVDAFLNLVSNAVKFSGGDISVSLASGRQQCVITVADSVCPDRSEPLAALEMKRGLKSVQNTARLHEGRLLFSKSRDGRFSAKMALSTALPRGKRFHAPPFTEYLENRFSPVHVGLCDCLDRLD